MPTDDQRRAIQRHSEPIDAFEAKLDRLRAELERERSAYAAHLDGGLSGDALVAHDAGEDDQKPYQGPSPEVLDDRPLTVGDMREYCASMVERGVAEAREGKPEITPYITPKMILAEIQAALKIARRQAEVLSMSSQGRETIARFGTKVYDLKRRGYKGLTQFAAEDLYYKAFDKARKLGSVVPSILDDLPRHADPGHGLDLLSDWLNAVMVSAASPPVPAPGGMNGDAREIPNLATRRAIQRYVGPIDEFDARMAEREKELANLGRRYDALTCRIREARKAGRDADEEVADRSQCEGQVAALRGEIGRAKLDHGRAWGTQPYDSPLRIIKFIDDEEFRLKHALYMANKGIYDDLGVAYFDAEYGKLYAAAWRRALDFSPLALGVLVELPHRDNPGVGIVEVRAWMVAAMAAEHSDAEPTGQSDRCPLTIARDAYCHRLCVEKMPYKAMAKAVNAEPTWSDLDPITTGPGIKYRAEIHIKANGLPPLDARQRGGNRRGRRPRRNQ